MADASAKIAKSAVEYSVGGDHCGACRHWIESAEDEATETGRCKLVAGEIGEDMWCKLFQRETKVIGRGDD